MKPLAIILTVVVAFSCLAPSAHADRKSREEEKAQQQRLERQLRDVEYILKHESDGTLSDRKAALAAMISTGVAPDEAYWQAGYIKRGDEWVSVQDRWLTPEQEQHLDEYNKARSNTIDTDEGHYKLAQWCAENGFDAQAYGHLKAVLLNNPDHAGLRQMLGYQRIGDRWMNAEDYEAAVREAERLAKELQEWGPQVVKIRDGLNSSNPQDQNSAKVQLKEIREISAVPAMEMILLPSSDIAAVACVDQLCEIDHRRSSIALCKASLFLPESAESAKLAAIEELQTRPLEDFVPVLLDQTQTPLTMQYRLFRISRTNYAFGPLPVFNPYSQTRNIEWVTIDISNETKHELRNHCLQLILNDTTSHVIPSWVSTNMRNLILQSQNAYPQSAKTADAYEAEQQKRIETLYQVERAVRFQNFEIEDFNDDISELLSSILRQEKLSEPEDWWTWWNARMEVAAGTKLVQEVQEVAQIQPPVTSVAIDYSCFTAGTPVWTDRGPRPIEQLKVGDMALTQDVETGELMYRPVIRTTTRKPKPLVTIDLGAEQITSTGGHPFFVTGEGWVRARELKAGQILHTPTGTIKIDSVTETPEDETFNLVIDGFHTYFVGMSQVLVHDVSITSPTDAIVPGLLDR